MKTESLVSQKLSLKPSSTVDAQIFNVHRLLLAQKPLTKTRTLWPKKSSKKPSSTADVDIFCANKLLLTDKPLMKTESLVSQKSFSKTSSTAEAEIFTLHGLLLAQKSLMKTRTLGRKTHPRCLVLRLTLTSTTHIDYSWQKNSSQNWVPAVPKFILETHFYGWRWNLQCT